MSWDTSALNPMQRADAIREQEDLLKALEKLQSEPGYEVGTDARHELDVQILEGFNLLNALRG